MKAIVTGAAGFIGFHAARELLRRGWNVCGVDNFNDYYDVRLKRDRDAILRRERNFLSREFDICDYDRLTRLFVEERPDAVLCLGQAGGRRALTPERVAVNLMDARIPDNEGAQPEDEPVIPGAPAAYFATLPVKAMAEAIRAASSRESPVTSVKAQKTAWAQL